MARRRAGQGSIYPQGDRWRGSVRQPGGKRRYVSGATMREVEQKLARIRRDAEAGLVAAAPERMTVGGYLTSWVEGRKASLKPSTITCYELQTERLKTLAPIPLPKLRPIDIREVESALLEQGLSRRSVQLAHAVLRAALKDAVRMELLSRNPADAVRAPTPERHELTVLDRAQARRLSEATRGHRLHALWVVLVTGGLRIGEALALTWADVDLDRGRLTVNKGLVPKRGGGVDVVTPKTKSSRRTVKLSEVAAAALRAHALIQGEEITAAPTWHEGGYVFCRKDGAPYHPTSLHVPFKDALKAAGLDSIRIHDLRHSCATILLVEGVHPKLVQEMLGHSTIRITLDTYSHVLPISHGDAADAMDRAFAD